MRENFFEAGLFADPAWDILLDLYLAKLDQRRTATSSLCAAASVPTTTALRYIGKLVDGGMLLRRPNPFDARVVHIELAEGTAEQMRSYFERLSALQLSAVGR